MESTLQFAQEEGTGMVGGIGLPRCLGKLSGQLMGVVVGLGVGYAVVRLGGSEELAVKIGRFVFSGTSLWLPTQTFGIRR